MKKILDLTTRAKLFLGFGLMILFLAAAIATAYTGITAIRDSQKKLYAEDFANAVDMKDVRANQNAIRADVLTILLATDPLDREAAQQDIAQRDKENDAAMERLLDRAENDPALRSKLEGFTAIRNAYRQTRETQVIPLIVAGKVEEAEVLALGVQEEHNQQMRSIADELVEEADRRAQASLTQAEQRANNSIRLFAIVGLVALLSGAGMALFLDRIIVDPLKTLSGVAERVATGDLTVDLPLDPRADEVGALAQAFRRMVEALRQVNREIREGVNVLAASASEILASTTQVASGAAETAAAVSQTTTTVEEVKQTAQVATQKAKYVSDSAQKSAQVSQTGKQAVDATIEGMQRIREQMESIAESIVRLSEQSQAIGEIIASVNDLAEQSNLLAVNAAIEAAKAGEQGKSFAVVAQEVKSLAEQSKQATAQVRTILSDIQKATGAAVMATEQGSKAVEAGVKQSAEASESIRLLADSISEAAQAATQIAASSQQQSAGMDQVALAMENIKVASTQNVASTRQAEAALRESEERYRRLVELSPVAIFVHSHGALLFANVAGATMLGAAHPDELMGKSLLDFIHPDHRQLMAMRAGQIEQAGKPRHQEETQFVAADGRTVYTEVSSTPITYRGQAARLAIVRDISKRRQAEKELAERSRLLEAFFANTLTSIALLDRDFNFVRVNEAYARAGTRDVSDFPGHNHFEFYPSDAQAIFEDVVKTRKSFQIFARPFVFPDHPDWETTYWDWTLVPILDSAGEVEFLVFTLHDVSERVRAEAERQKLASAVEQSDVGVMIVNRQGVIEFVNAALERIAGHSRRDLLGQTPSMLQSGAHSKEFYARLWGTINAGETFHSVFTDKTKEGKHIHVDQTISPIRDAQGNIIHFVSVWKDITEQVQAEATLREREAFYRALIEHSYDAITLIDAGGRRICNTPSNTRITGRAPEETVGQNFAEVLHPDDLPVATNLFAQLLRSPGVTLQTQVRIRHKDGTWRWVEATGTNLLGDPSVGAIVANYHDITTRVQANQERDEILEQVRAGRERLQTLSRRLVEVQEAERRRIALELHDEIGQTLTGLRLSLELPARLPAEAATARLAQARTIVDELLRYVENLALDLRPAMLDDLGLLSALLWQIERYSTRTGVRVNCKHTGLNRRFPPEIETTAFRIMQEALTNTARHAGVDDVTVRLWATPEILGLQVEDGGSGFDPEAALSAGATSGLSGMRERALLSGGHFEIESEPDKGTRLTVELPHGSQLEKREQPR